MNRLKYLKKLICTWVESELLKKNVFERVTRISMLNAHALCLLFLNLSSELRIR